mmetsp:Transcript_15683/g.29935  ORF Transcript_15683/g.29935 Transcript_15683/m.29935 type:complete len:218 (-) Transcript_15683:12-665(-)
MHRNIFDDGRIHGTIFEFLFRCTRPHDGHGFDFIQDIPPVQNPPENRVMIVQMWLRVVKDKELRSIRVGSFVCHTEDAALVVNIVRVELIGKGNVAPNRLPAFDASLVFCTPSLNHKAFYVTMKYGSIVCSRGSQSKKVESCTGASVAVYFELNVSRRGVQCDGHFRGWLGIGKCFVIEWDLESLVLFPVSTTSIKYYKGLLLLFVLQIIWKKGMVW